VSIPNVGPIPDVIDGDDIYATWGNAVGASSLGRVVHRFASTAERDTTIPPGQLVRGMLAVTTDTDTLWQAIGAPPSTWLAVNGVQLLGVGLSAADITTAAWVTLGTLNLGIQNYPRLVEASAAVLGSIVNAGVSVRLSIQLNGVVQRQIQSRNLATGENASFSFDAPMIVAANGPATVTFAAQLIGALGGAFRIVVDASFSILQTVARPALPALTSL
jgi:hypothetical protein